MKSENRISAAVSEVGSEAAEQFDELQSTFTSAFARLTHETGRFIRQRPWTAVGILVAAGLIMGLINKNRD